MPTAVCFPRDRRWQPRPFYEEGLNAIGYKIARDIRTPRYGDVIVLWNRMVATGEDHLARQWEKAGATVLVTENGWIGKAPDGGKMYALCKGHHNGPGWWPVGTEDRWSRLGIELKPWREDGKHILILAQRGFGPPEVAMPKLWPEMSAKQLKAVTSRQVKIRHHPGRNKDTATPLEKDLEGCWACVTWSSGAAIKALALGYPVFYALKNWIGATAARKFVAEIDNPAMPDRLPMFHRLTHAQWTVDEIASGEPFRRLLSEPSIVGH